MEVECDGSGWLAADELEGICLDLVFLDLLVAVCLGFLLLHLLCGGDEVFT